MNPQNVNTEPDEYSQQATIEILLKLIEKSSTWLKKMERDSLIIIALLILTPLAGFGSALYGQAKMAFLGDYLIPSAIVGICILFVFIAYLVYRHVTIRREVKLWQERLHTLQRKTDELLSKL